MVEFLKSTPCCHKLPKSILNRLYYGVEKAQLIKGQNLVSEGDPVEYIYFVKEGNFEMSKKLVLNDRVENQRVIENDVIRSLLFNHNKNQDNIHIRRVMGKSTYHNI